jgi:c-di-GMP-binding flagellar brake protein YcgR
MDERRNFVRLKKRLEVEYKIIIDKFANTSMAPSTSFTDTLSGNGMSMYIPKTMDIGQKLELTIKLPTEQLEMAGEVIDNKIIAENQYEIILRFIQVDEPVREQLVRYIMREGVKPKPKK